MTLQLLQQDWARLAACVGADPEPFHPDKHTRRAAIRAAKAVCASCPVAAECLADALDRDEEFGIWGGLEAHERKSLQRRTRRLL